MLKCAALGRCSYLSSAVALTEGGNAFEISVGTPCKGLSNPESLVLFFQRCQHQYAYYLQVLLNAWQVYLICTGHVWEARFDQVYCQYMR